MVRLKQIVCKKKLEETKQEKILKAKRDKYKSEKSGEKYDKSHFVHRSHILDEIRYYQGLTDCVILKKPFQRLVKEILRDIQVGKPLPVHRMACKAICILQEIAENFLVDLMNDSVICAMHASRVTVIPKDFELVLRLAPRY